MNKSLVFLLGLLIFTPLTYAYSEEGSRMGERISHNPCSMQSMKGMKGMMSMKDMEKSGFLQKKVIDGYDVNFYIMKAPEGMTHGGTHQLIIKVEKNNETMALKAVNSKITHLNGKSESKMMMKMGDWYMAEYNLNHAGGHEVMVLFKTADESKHFGGVTFARVK